MAASVVFLCSVSVVERLGLWMCRESWAHKRLFNLLPQFSRLGIQGPASHVGLFFVIFVVFLIWAFFLLSFFYILASMLYIHVFFYAL